jgi:hypothetical protein
MSKERIKIKKYLRKEMLKIPNDASVEKGKKPFAFCYAQAKFDALMDIDRDLKLGAFYKKEKL